MSTTKDQAAAILARVQAIADAQIKPMMGEYLVYADGKLVGQINDGQLFVKVTTFGEKFALELERASPYPGAKPAFIIPVDRQFDTDWLGRFITGTLAELPVASKRS